MVIVLLVPHALHPAMVAVVAVVATSTHVVVVAMVFKSVLADHVATAAIVTGSTPVETWSAHVVVVVVVTMALRPSSSTPELLAHAAPSPAVEIAATTTTESRATEAVMRLVEAPSSPLGSTRVLMAVIHAAADI